MKGERDEMANHSIDTPAVESGNLADSVRGVPTPDHQQPPVTLTRFVLRSDAEASSLAALIRSSLFQTFLRQGFWHAHHVDLIWRYNGEDVREEADWLKDLFYALRPKPTIKELERILASDPGAVEITPDGTVIPRSVT